MVVIRVAVFYVHVSEYLISFKIKGMKKINGLNLFFQLSHSEAESCETVKFIN